MKNTAVFGIFRTQSELDRTVEALKNSGFRSSDISCLISQNAGNKELATEKNSKAPEGAVTGAAAGLAVGGTLGWLVGIGSLAIPGLGPFIAAGPIMAALAGASVGGAVGGVTGSLIGFGMPEYEAKRYEGMVKEGKMLLSVHCDDAEWTKKAKDILKAQGATDIASTSQAKATVAGSETDRPYTRETVTGDIL